MSREMQIRSATIADLDTLAAIEAACFPPSEAAGRKSLEGRLLSYPEHFYILLDGDEPVGFINGLCTDEADLRDEMYDDPGLHNENGAWQMVFGLDTLPSHRRQGCAARLMEHLIENAKKQGRKGVVLTCKEGLIHYYSRFGFINEGLSSSNHGDVTWYQMRLTF